MLLGLVYLSAMSVVAQPFAVATTVGDPISPSAFTFHAAGAQCRVASSGRGACGRWRFKLPVDDGVIEELFVAPGDDLILVYEVSDGEGNWGHIARLQPGRRQPSWTNSFGGLNTATPIIHGDTIIVAALCHIASYEVATGIVRWQHDWEYDSEFGTNVRVEIEGATACYHSRLNDQQDRQVVCYDAKTGLPVRQPGG
jgi:hypothetical protein